MIRFYCLAVEEVHNIASCYPNMVQLRPVLVSRGHLHYVTKISTVTGFVGECLCFHKCMEMLVSITKSSMSVLV